MHQLFTWSHYHKQLTCFLRFELFFEMQEGYIFLFLVQETSRAIVRLFFLIFFSIIFFWCVIYSFPVISIHKRFNFCCSFRMPRTFSWFKVPVTAYWKHSHFIDKIYCWFFVFLYPIETIFIWSTSIWIYFMTFIIQ